MQIREFNYEEDINDVVCLFNRSFSTNISREFFEWKHKDNPFGRSYGLVAVEDDKIIGLRMFMKWKFSKGGQTVTAFRPVDTCTDPNYRGKGIFKKLTLQGLQENIGYFDLVFNTPNSNSLPGYLKMGWKRTEKLFRYKLGVIKPFISKKKFEIINIDEIDSDILLNCNTEFSTELSQNYLKWRYKFSKYKAAKFQDGTIVVFRLKKIKGIKVLVLLEYCGAKENLNNYLNRLALQQRTFFVYYLRNESFTDMGFYLSFTRGKQDVVVKEDNGANVPYITFSAGDLEGIL